MDLFDDLPEPVNKELRVERDDADNPQAVLPGSRGAKRDSQDSSCESLEPTLESSETSKKRRNHADFVATLRGYVAERKGEREDMQDAHLILDQLPLEPTANVPVDGSCGVSFYGVFDGHGGARASSFAARWLATNLSSRFPKGSSAQIEKDIGKSLIAAFKKTDEDFLKEATKQKPSWKDGTTALTILALRNTLYIANLGDSKAVLYRNSGRKWTNGGGTVVCLSRDHKPTSYEERMRIQKMGGFVREGRVMGVLEVSRSIGDGQFKTVGVTCLPDIKRCVLTEDDRFIVMACDGLWKVFTNEEACEFVCDVLKTSGADVEPNAYHVACVRLANQAILRGSDDNVTVLIVAVDRSAAEDS